MEAKFQQTLDNFKSKIRYFNYSEKTLNVYSSSKTTEIYTHVSNNLLSKVNLPI